MSRSTLKYIAIIAMTLDHISAYFLPIDTPLGFVLRLIGRLTSPIMCYFIAEGFRFTSDRLKYGLRLFVFAVVSQPAFYFADTSQPFRLNMLFTLLIGFLMLCAYEKIKSTALKCIAIMLLLTASYFCDWGIIAPMWILSFRILRDDRKALLTAFTLISLMHIIINTVACIATDLPVYSQLWQAGVLLFIPAIAFYNGKNGAKGFISKWFFYIYYPLHLAIIGIIRIFALKILPY